MLQIRDNRYFQKEEIVCGKVARHQRKEIVEFLSFGNIGDAAGELN
jgi:hypothetical protein